MHADQTHGINDLRVFFIKNKKTIPVYADIPTAKYLIKTFSYCFKKSYNEYPPILNLNRIKKKLSFLYKSLISFLFTILYGKIIFCKNPEKEKNILITEGADGGLLRIFNVLSFDPSFTTIISIV